MYILKKNVFLMMPGMFNTTSRWSSSSCCTRLHQGQKNCTSLHSIEKVPLRIQTRVALKSKPRFSCRLYLSCKHASDVSSSIQFENGCCRDLHLKRRVGTAIEYKHQIRKELRKQKDLLSNYQRTVYLWNTNIIMEVIVKIWEKGKYGIIEF